MKKLVTFVLFLPIIWCVSTSCSYRTLINPIPLKEEDGTRLEVNLTNSVNSGEIKYSKSPSIEDEPLKIAVEDNKTFSYIFEDKLMLKNTEDGSEQTLIGKGASFVYDFNIKDGFLAYATYGSSEDKIIIYNLKTKYKKVVQSIRSSPREIKWSPDRKYIVVDFGTGVIGDTKVYDVAKDSWISIGAHTSGFVLSPFNNTIALAVTEKVEPETPMEKGQSLSIATFSPDERNSLHTLVKGTSDFYYRPIEWIDKTTIAIAKKYFSEGKDPSYYKLNIENGDLEEIQKSDINFFKEHDDLPPEASNVLVNVSPNKKLVLYSVYDEAMKKSKIRLWDREKKSITDFPAGSDARWVTK